MVSLCKKRDQVAYASIVISKLKRNTTNLSNHLLRRHPSIKSVSQRKLVVANDGIGVGDDKKKLECVPVPFPYNTTNAFFSIACLFENCIFLHFLSFYCIYFVI